MYPGPTPASPAPCARLRVRRSIFRGSRFTIWCVGKKQDEKYYFIAEKIVLEKKIVKIFKIENFQNRNFRTKKNENRKIRKIFRTKKNENFPNKKKRK